MAILWVICDLELCKDKTMDLMGVPTGLQQEQMHNLFWGSLPQILRLEQMYPTSKVAAQLEGSIRPMVLQAHKRDSRLSNPLRLQPVK
jgi:hypothetical protein